MTSRSLTAHLASSQRASLMAHILQGTRRCGLWCALWCSLWCSLCLVACEGKVDRSPNVLPSGAAGSSLGGSGGGAGVDSAGVMMGGAGVMSGGATPLACATCPVVGAWYRFTKLEIASLDSNPDHSAIGLLNSLWSADISKDQLNVMFEVKEVSGSQITIRALNAARYNTPDTGYCLLPDTAIEFTFNRDGCDFINPEPSGINIYAGSVDIPKNCSPMLAAPNTIPVRGVTLTGTFSDDCGQIISGRVPSASIPQTGLAQTCTCLSPIVENCQGLDPSFESEQCAGCNDPYTSLRQQLSIFGDLSYGCEANGEAAVCLEALFEAERLDFTPSDC